MREIVLDTETTGLDPFSGDKIVEIGAIELVRHVPTKNVFHEYIDPQRDIPQEAFDVHGLSSDFLRGKPKFAEIANKFLSFIGDTKLIIHNAAFDMKFLNAELASINLPQLPKDQAIDTLDIARRRFPGSPASLDALCRRFAIDNSSRTLHGALLDSEILAEVYLELIGGRQPDFALSTAFNQSTGLHPESDWTLPERSLPLRSRISDIEKKAHEEFIRKLGNTTLWK
jgi:DNA polymerase-3 subunit epsilon